MTDPLIYIVLNGELNMSPGKAAAQAVHAAMMLENEYKGRFADKVRRTVIVLDAKNSEQIKNLHAYLWNNNIFSAYYVDEGMNEVDAYSVTALAVEPIEADDETKREIFESFSLHGNTGNRAHKAWIALSDVINNGDGWLGVPWYVRRTINWLNNRRKA